MKIIVEKKTGLVQYALDDEQPIIIEGKRILMSGAGHNGRDRIVCDLNTSNAELIEDVIMPDGFDKTRHGNKYRYDKDKKEFTPNQDI